MFVIKAGISFADGLLLALEFTSSNAAAVDLQSGHGKGGLMRRGIPFATTRIL